jgi:hypothetical protein
MTAPPPKKSLAVYEFGEKHETARQTKNDNIKRLMLDNYGYTYTQNM